MIWTQPNQYLQISSAPNPLKFDLEKEERKEKMENEMKALQDRLSAARRRLSSAPKAQQPLKYDPQTGKFVPVGYDDGIPVENPDPKKHKEIDFLKMTKKGWEAFMRSQRAQGSDHQIRELNAQRAEAQLRLKEAQEQRGGRGRGGRGG